jgi:hypothetical protein
MGERRGVYRISVGNLRETVHLGDQAVDRKIILIWILRKLAVAIWTGSSWLRIRTGGGNL